MKNKVLYIAIAGLIVFIFNRECTRPGTEAPANDTIVFTDTIPGDSVPYIVEINRKIPVPVYIDTGSTHWRMLPIDTFEILKDYFAKYGYDDTLMNDTSAFIRLQSHVTGNRLYYDQLFFQNKRVKQINTTIINPTAKRRLMLYLGGGINMIPGSPGISADILLIPKSKLALDAGYDPFNKMVILKGFYKIQFKKKN